MQASHEAMVRAYFQMSRDRVEDFLQNRWIPEFLGTFVQDANLMDLLTVRETVTDEESTRDGLSDAERGEIVLEFAEAAVEEIERRRKELTLPIDGLENDLLRGLRGNYAQLIQMQNGVTAFLASAVDVTVEQDAVLQRLGLLEARDSIIERALSTNDMIVELTEGAGKAEDIIDQLKERLNIGASDDANEEEIIDAQSIQ